MYIEGQELPVCGAQELPVCVRIHLSFCLVFLANNKTEITKKDPCADFSSAEQQFFCSKVEKMLYFCTRKMCISL